MERRSGSDRRVADRRQGRERAARILAILGPDFRQAKTTPNESNRFFDKDVTALEVPDEYYKTEERLQEIGLTRFEPLVLPQRTLRENDPLWEGKVKPGQWFWEEIQFRDLLQYRNLKHESAILQKGIYLIDGRPKPDYKVYGEQRYEDDEFMEKMIKGLRRKGAIDSGRAIPEYSRFGVSPKEIDEVILPEISRAIGKKALGSEGKVVNNPYIVFNIVGNMRHPEWGKSNTEEWFADKFGSDSRLYGGDSRNGGLADAYPGYSYSSSDRVGFRPLIVFSSKT